MGTGRRGRQYADFRMRIEKAQAGDQRIRRQLDVWIEHEVIVCVAAVHDQVVRAAITDVGVAVKVIHGHAGILEPRLAETYHRFRGRARDRVVDQHDVGGAEQSCAPRRVERRRQRAEAAFEKREVGLVRDDADRQRYGSQGGSLNAQR